MDEQHVNDTDIAIVGLGLRFPGAPNAEVYFQNLRDGVESIRVLSEEELLAAGESIERLRKPNYVPSACVLEGMDQFDGEFFGFSPKECGILDPQHRQLYECAWEALEDAGHPPEHFSGPVGVFAGCGMGSYFYFNLCSHEDLMDSVGMFLLRHTGNDKDFLATRVSYLLNLKGPSVNVQTACSTSLVAVHMACQSLLSGECDMALAGGVTIELPHGRGYLYQDGEILSPDGHCHAFDHRAQGTVFGSGAGVVVLRRLKDALEDGDHIYAVVKGSAINNDGAGKVGYLAPSVEGQAACMIEAHAVAQVSPDTISYVECHGTGTYMGDPIEVAALTQAFRQATSRKGFCRIGSVKTNIGHLDTAAGVASLAKTALALHHRQIPPSLGYEKPNPTIDFESSPFVVNADLFDWNQVAGPRRAAVNSLGVGGTNAHVVLEEAPPSLPSSKSQKPFQLLMLSGKNRGALDENAARLAAHLKAHPELDLADVAYTLKVGRRAFEQRRVLACGTREEAIQLLEENSARRVFTHRTLETAPNIAFMFPGGGAQYVGMGRDLYRREPVFQRWIDRGCAYLETRLDYDLKGLMFAEGDAVADAAARFQRPSVQLPAIFLVEFALAQLWIENGVKPAALIGHSLGENTAACLAGVLSFEDALGLVLIRGQLFDKVPAGGMLSVPLAAGKLEPMLRGRLDLACVNGPELCVVSGPVADLLAFQSELLEQDIEAQRIAIDIAAHSRMLEDMLGPFGEYLHKIRLNPPQIPFISNRTGDWITAEQATSPMYWVEHLRHTVRFAEGIETLVKSPDRVLLEVGPGKTLGSLAKQAPGVQAQTVLSSLRHAEEVVDDSAFFLTVLGRLWALGFELDAEQLWKGERRRRVSLPTYAFQHKRYFIEANERQGERKSLKLLKKHENLDQWFYRPVWNQCSVSAAAGDERQRWLVFMDELGLGERLVERLRRRGHEVVTVSTGDAFFKEGEWTYRLAPEHGREGYSELVRALVESERLPNRILHLWLLAKEETFRPGSSFFHRNQERGFYSLFYVMQALGAEALPQSLHISVVSNGIERVEQAQLAYPDQATVLGPCRVIPREYPGVTCSSIDIELPSITALNLKRPWQLLSGDRTSGLDALVEQVGLELRAAPKTLSVAYRGGKRFEQSFEPTAAPKPRLDSALELGGAVWLITGGLGGIGLTLSEHLARKCRAKLVLVSRSPLPERQQWSSWCSTHDETDTTRRRIEQVKKLEALGAEVLVVAADVTDIEAMREAVRAGRARFGRITGVLHAAGVVADALIQTKKPSEIEAVFAPKIHGTRVLDEVLRKTPPDVLVLCSSTSTAIAPVGQVDYVAANAYLNAFAESRANDPNTRVVAVNWGVWNAVGMAAEAAGRMGKSSAELSVAEKPAAHPLFLSKREEKDRSIVLKGLLSSKSQWLLDDHRTASGQALVPGTGYIALARAALTECGEHGPFELRELFFSRPLFVSDADSREMRVVMQPTAEGYEFRVQSKQSLEGDAIGWLLHAQGSIVLKYTGESQAIDLTAIRERCPLDERANGRPLQAAQEAHLSFGPRWRVLTETRCGEQEALAELELSPHFSADLFDYPLHPALLDIATGFAMKLIEGYAAQSLWVPISYKRIRAERPLPRRIFSWVRNHGYNRSDAEFAHFDVAIADEAGNVLVEVEQFAIRRLAERAQIGAEREFGAGELEQQFVVKSEAERELSPSELVFRENLNSGILPQEGAQAFERALALATPQIIISSLPLDGLIEQAAQTKDLGASRQAEFERPDLDSEFVAARDEIEATLLSFWEELLGVRGVGVKDSFFDLGGHSLIAVRLFSKIKKTYGVEFPISVLFEAPSVESCAQLIRDARPEIAQAGSSAEKVAAPAKRFRHVVPMHEGEAGRRTPFFLVSGMFGNVLNLRHLAHLIGTDRAVYGLQARGLYGGEPPHETFEEMARDYLAEVRTVQPEGPYLLGGFSGGGLTAYEMARQLREAGAEVGTVMLLDTPVPQWETLTTRDKVTIHLQNMQRQGAGYVLEWARRRYEWEREQMRKRAEGHNADSQPFVFHSEQIEAAFYRALGRYEVPHQAIKVLLFRPKFSPAYELSNGRAIDENRTFVYRDNGWTPYVDEVDIKEVPGNHDTMVLEPNVRVLAAKMRKAILAAELEQQSSVFAPRAAE